MEGERFSHEPLAVLSVLPMAILFGQNRTLFLPGARGTASQLDLVVGVVLQDATAASFSINVKDVGDETAVALMK